MNAGHGKRLRHNRNIQIVLIILRIRLRGGRRLRLRDVQNGAGMNMEPIGGVKAHPAVDVRDGCLDAVIAALRDGFVPVEGIGVARDQKFAVHIP